MISNDKEFKIIKVFEHPPRCIRVITNSPNKLAIYYPNFINPCYYGMIYKETDNLAPFKAVYSRKLHKSEGSSLIMLNNMLQHLKDNLTPFHQ